MTGLNRFRTGRNDGLLQIQQDTSVFQKQWEISRVAKKMLATKNGLIH